MDSAIAPGAEKALQGRGGLHARILSSGAGIEVRVGWITPRSHPFCASCDRIRMNAGGYLSRCLMDEGGVPIAELIRTTDETSAPFAMDQYLSSKKSPAAMVRTDSMASIGG
jgi:molybdenum cofactor biosynthesis enzyme MoaA